MGNGGVDMKNQGCVMMCWEGDGKNSDFSSLITAR